MIFTAKTQKPILHNIINCNKIQTLFGQTSENIFHEDLKAVSLYNLGSVVRTDGRLFLHFPPLLPAPAFSTPAFSVAPIFCDILSCPQQLQILCRSWTRQSCAVYCCVHRSRPRRRSFCFTLPTSGRFVGEAVRGRRGRCRSWGAHAATFQFGGI